MALFNASEWAVLTQVEHDVDIRGLDDLTGRVVDESHSAPRGVEDTIVPTPNRHYSCPE